MYNKISYIYKVTQVISMLILKSFKILNEKT